MLFVRRLAVTLAFFMFLLKCDFANTNAVIKAHNGFRKMRTKTYKNHPEEDTLSHSLATAGS